LLKDFSRVFKRAEQNLDRSKRLVSIVESLLRADELSPKYDVSRSDVLRAAVVLTHATIEDTLRTVGREALLLWGNDELENIGLPDNNRPGTRPKFTLKELAHYKDKLVNDVLRDSIDDYIQRQTFNSVTDIIRFLERIDIQSDLIKSSKPERLDPMIKRRHKIVHECDMKDGVLNALDADTVKTWIESARQFLIAMSNSFGIRKNRPAFIADALQIKAAPKKS
jgi:Arc/MetJ-type ribon-helix-helix transcriptional regulator